MVDVEVAHARGRCCCGRRSFYRCKSYLETEGERCEGKATGYGCVQLVEQIMTGEMRSVRATAATVVLGDVGGGDDRSDLERLIRLLTNEDTTDITERQLVVLRQACKVRPHGFRFGELAYVERLLPLLAHKVSAGLPASPFRVLLLRFLDICSLAPVRDRANQEFTEHGLAAKSSLFRVVGELLWSPDFGIQSATAEVLRKVAAGNDPTRPNTPDDQENPRFGECPHDLRPKPRDVNQALLLGCGVVKSVVVCLFKVLGDVMTSLTELLDDGSSLSSSSFDDGGKVGAAGGVGDERAQPWKVADEGAQPWKSSAASGMPTPGEGNLDNTQEASFEDENDIDSSTTKADEGAFVGKVNEIDGGDRGGSQRGSASDLEMKHAVLLSLLRLVRELSKDAKSSAAMVEGGLVALLVQVMQAARGIRDPTLSITVEVMWNCLEHSQNVMDNDPPAASRTSLIRKARKSNAAFALSNWNGVAALRDTVEALLIGGFRNKDKALRNEAVIVASQLSGNSRSHALFRSTGMLLLLLRYSTAVETGLADGNPLAAEVEARTYSIASNEGNLSIGSDSSCGGGGDGAARNGPERVRVPELGPLADPRNFSTTMDVDMELKLLLWSLLADLCKRDARNVEVVNASPLMETLLMYMDLVVEEGQSGDALPPGMGRSISLASMPPLGNGQQLNSPTAVSPTTPAFSPVDGCEVSARHTGTAFADPETDNRVSPAPFSGHTPTSVEVPALSPVAQSKTGGSARPGPPASSGGQSVNSSLKSAAAKKRATSGGVGSDEAQEIVGATQLFVPASVFRLPVTSIQLLQAKAMASLLRLAPRCPRKFQALGGHMVTLRLLERLGNRPDNQRLITMATKMLATVVALPGLKQELGRVDGVRIMLDRLSDVWKCERHGGYGGVAGGNVVGGSVVVGGGGYGGGGGDVRDVRTDMVIILCRLCEDCPENQEAFRKADGVPIMMAAVKAYCKARSEANQREGLDSSRGGGAGAAVGVEPRGGSSLGIAGGMEPGVSSDEICDPSLVHIIDCVWVAVVGNRRSEARLLQCEGLDTLLDLLELCPVFMRHQVTGVIADLLRNKRSIPYARAWRSDLNMLSITQLMVRLWVAEESRLGVSRPNGVLQNLWQPLQSHDRGGNCRRRFKRQAAGRDQSRPASREAAAGPGQSTMSGGGGGNRGTVDVRSSQTNLCGRDGAPVADPDGGASARSDASADTRGGFTAPMPSVGGAEHTSESKGHDGGSGDGGGTTHDANGSSSLAVALALKVGKRSVAVGQGRGSGGRRKQASQLGPEASIAKAMMNLDLRGKIAAVLSMVGFDGSATDGLGPSDLKASYMATNYLDFRAGEAWQAVAGELETQQINPIAADALVLDTMLERAFDCAQEVKSKQMALTVEQEQRDAETEEDFFAGILFQRDQEIRQAIIKRNALVPGATKKRRAAQKAQASMLKRSSDGSLGGSSGMEAVSDRGPPEDDFGGKDAVDNDGQGEGADAKQSAAG